MTVRPKSLTPLEIPNPRPIQIAWLYASGSVTVLGFCGD